jgi:hypothetical protein
MKLVFKADDGTDFDTEVLCRQYERRLKNPMAMLAINNDPAVQPRDVTRFDLGKTASCLTLHFEDGSMIEITHTDVCVYNGDQTQRLAQYDRRRTEDVSQG